MKLLDKPIRVDKSATFNFSIDKDGWQMISVSARAKSEKQRENATDDEDLRVEIDNLTFPSLSDSQRLFDSPAAFSGGKLKNNLQTNYFVIYLDVGKHTLTLTPDGSPLVEKIEFQLLNSFPLINLELNEEAEKANGRPWINFVFVNLGLSAFSVKATARWLFPDGDDIKIIVDGQIKNNNLSILHKNWIFASNVLRKFFGSETTKKTFTENLPVKNLHYLEFWADESPIIHTLNFNLDESAKSPKRVPGADDPLWTGNFHDDPSEIILARLVLGEAENQHKEAKTGVGFTVINRIRKHNPYWGSTVHEVVLKEHQYDGIWNVKRKDRVRDPLKVKTAKTIRIWQECYEIAIGTLLGNLEDPTNGATHFHSFIRPEEFPSWAKQKYFKIKIGAFYFYELEA